MNSFNSKKLRTPIRTCVYVLSDRYNHPSFTKFATTISRSAYVIFPIASTCCCVVACVIVPTPSPFFSSLLLFFDNSCACVMNASWLCPKNRSKSMPLRHVSSVRKISSKTTRNRAISRGDLVVGNPFTYDSFVKLEFTLQIPKYIFSSPRTKRTFLMSNPIFVRNLSFTCPQNWSNSFCDGNAFSMSFSRFVSKSRNSSFAFDSSMNFRLMSALMKSFSFAFIIIVLAL
mmetsp:Transcript_1925/g.6159  ORF Transcript_1925/g.6159 Transcript_1925/m.6159 type:complete len:230 (+) Transcript_1925:961-1650(+)